MSDRLLRMIDKNKGLRAFAAETTVLVENARKTHWLSPAATAALGRTLTAGAMMGAMLKNPTDKLTIQIKGEGPLGGIVVASNHKSEVKGYVYNPEVDLPPNQYGKLDVSGAIGDNGYLNVIKDLGLKEPYIGFVPIVSGEIGDDLSYYFLKSEQIPSVVALGVLVDRTGEVLVSGGFIIQVMPEAGEKVIQELEDNLKGLSSVTALLSEGKKIEDIVMQIAGDEGMEIMATIEPQYICDCSMERMERALISLGKKELESLLEEKGEVEIQCHFCQNKYTFDRNQIEAFFE